MAHVEFQLQHRFEASPRVVWDEMIDWRAHESWVPFTRVDLEPGDPTAVGARFTATTGPGPLGMPDRMQIDRLDWDETERRGECVVDKLGPVLFGRAGFSVDPAGDGAVVEWFEDVEVKYAPQLLSPVLAKIGAAGFRLGFRRLAKQLDARTPVG